MSSKRGTTITMREKKPRQIQNILQKKWPIVMGKKSEEMKETEKDLSKCNVWVLIWGEGAETALRRLLRQLRII